MAFANSQFSLSQEGTSQEDLRKTDLENYRLTPEGAQEGSSGRVSGHLQPSYEDVVYDQPIVLQGKPSSGGAEYGDELELGGVDPTKLFDDPSYTRGMMHTSTISNGCSSEHKQSQLQDQLPTQEHTPATNLLASHQHILSCDRELDSGTGSEMQTLSVQVPGMKSSIDSLALFDYDDGELNELDPAIASCLRTPNISDTEDDIAISEV